MISVMEPTLHDLHRESGKSYRAVLEVMKSMAPEESPGTVEAIIGLVRRGTYKLTHIRALAAAWGVSQEIVENASNVTRRHRRELASAEADTGSPIPVL